MQIKQVQPFKTTKHLGSLWWPRWCHPKCVSNCPPHNNCNHLNPWSYQISHNTTSSCLYGLDYCYYNSIPLRFLFATFCYNLFNPSTLQSVSCHTLLDYKWRVWWRRRRRGNSVFCGKYSNWLAWRVHQPPANNACRRGVNYNNKKHKEIFALWYTTSHAWLLASGSH